MDGQDSNERRRKLTKTLMGVRDCTRFVRRMGSIHLAG